MVVRGYVQGIFFRDSCQREAARAGVNGWVRNCNDGAVEAVFEGPSGGVDQLVAWCRHGPPRARIDQVEVDDESPEGLVGFRVKGWD